MGEVQAIWASLYSVAISSSADQFFRLQQVEAASHLRDLEGALEQLRSLESQRALLRQQAAHDLRGNLSVVSLVTAGLKSGATDAAGTRRFLASLARNDNGLQSILQVATSLARLQGGREIRLLAEFDVLLLLEELAGATDGLVHDKNLFMRGDGPDPLVVQGDATKVRRIVQNLMLNALRYTMTGGVTVRWGAKGGDDSRRWFVAVQDTAPGLRAGLGFPLAGTLSIAPERAQATADAEGFVRVAPLTDEAVHPVMNDLRAPVQQSGEGLGL